MADQDNTPADSTPQPAPKQTSAPELPDEAKIVPDAPGSVAATPPDLTTDPAATDAVVDDIVRNEGDEVLRAQDAAVERAVVMKPSLLERSKNALHNWWDSPRRRYGTLVGIVIVLGLLMAVPFTRYAMLGLVFKEPVNIMVVDSKTGKPVSGVAVKLANKSAITEASGKTSLRSKLGNVTLTATKKYYRSHTSSVTITFSKQHNNFKIPLLALGRQVPIKVVNKVTGKPLANAEINVLGGKTKTDIHGLATVVSPSSASSQKANLQLAGYNNANITITVADGMVAANTFSLTPAGKIYFLSNQSGKIDVVKTNLDGTDRQTVLAGTGSEDSQTTSLLASRDWKYLALLSKRGGAVNPSVYLIDTTQADKLTTIDEGNATFNLVGWSGDSFVYQVQRLTVSDWQPNQQALKSYDATTGKATLLDQTQGSGTNAYDYLKQSFGSVYLLGDQIVYSKAWAAGYTSWSQLNSKSAELDSIGVAGSGHKIVKTFTVDASTQTSYVSINTALYEPNGLYISFSDGLKDNFYDYEDGQVSANPSLTSDNFYRTPYATYLLSPSGNQTFWTEQRDGKNALFIGDQDGKNQKQTASLSDYAPYGWYSDAYVLVTKNSSELYIMASDGSSPPLKITDYYKPAISYNSYGGGYGGL